MSLNLDELSLVHRGKPVFRAIARELDRAKRGEESGAEWADDARAVLEFLIREFLPSGSGFNCGTELDSDASTKDKLQFVTDFHHMDEFGGYDGWTQHRVIVTPSLVWGFELRVTGRDRNAIKDYIADTFHAALSAPIPGGRGGDLVESDVPPDLPPEIA